MGGDCNIIRRYFRKIRNQVHNGLTKPNIESKKMKNKEDKSYKNVNLPHGSISGRPDFRTMAKCQAKAKSTGQRCKNVAMKGKRVCYLHGGKSTGAKTERGKLLSKYACLTHGDYSARVKQNRRKLMELKPMAQAKRVAVMFRGTKISWSESFKLVNNAGISQSIT